MSLQQIWANGVDCWIEPFGLPGCIYMRPTDPQASVVAAMPPPFRDLWPRDPLQVFALTSTDPMGQPQSAEANMMALRQLEKELQELCRGQVGKSFWRSFGFHIQEGWREDGFTLVAEATAGRQHSFGGEGGLCGKHVPRLPVQLQLLGDCGFL
ncbi:Hypothetical protein SCF082_LOCUS15580 [Durusdinium trenchii]|uniref:Uncharacterized protein n=1 Tax=Durusdinium trenchii TaxID=1381693 RepID=A0ABP0K5D1_9DINO